MREKYSVPSIWNKLTGKQIDYALEARIFHIACLFTIFLFSCTIIFNYSIGLYTLSALLFPAVFATSGLYYLSRKKFKLKLAVSIYCILGNLAFIVFFLNHSGINGPGFIIYLLFFFLVMGIVPKSERLIWVVINGGVAFGLLFMQYLYPEVIPVTYKSKMSRHIDFAYVYFFTLLIIYFLLTSILDNYNKEKALAIQRAHELDLANQSKTKLFSILAHDLRSPLNSIQSFLEILQEMDVDEEEKRIINKSLLQETKYTRQMLGNLLSWSKTQMEGATVNLINLEPAYALRNTLLLQATIADDKNIVLHNQLEEDIQVKADFDMLELVIRNLVNNAIKFTRSGGEIIVSSEVHENEYWIMVKDNGIGIDKDAANKIFDIKPESTYGTNNEKGVGLGLVLCKEFIDAQQGRIWMESTLGIGSTFFVSLDLAIPAEFSAPLR